MRKIIAGVLLTVLAVAAVYAAPPQRAGGGEHKIISIKIVPKPQPADAPESTLRVGQRLWFVVFAAWKIPYAGDVTDKAKITVSRPKVAGLEKDGYLVAKRPGKVTVKAVLRVSDRGDQHVVLAADEDAGAYPVITFTDRMESTVIK